MNDPVKKAPTLEQLIEAKLGPDFDQEALDNEWRVSWFPAPGKMEPRNLDIGQRWPANPYLRVYLIFGDEEEARVYCYPDLNAEAEDPNACKAFLTAHSCLTKDKLPKHHLAPTLFRLSMHGPVYRAASMSTERFVEKVVEEFEAADEDRAVEERIAVTDYLRKLGLLDAANAIEAEAHLDDAPEPS